MSSEHLRKVGELFDATLELDPQERSEFLKNACGTDQALVSDVESLIAAHYQAGNFIETPALGSVTEVIFDHEELIPAGEKIGVYRIIREIGRGGMGAVYLAERADEQFKKYVAIKILKRGMDSYVLLRYFRGERQILASFDHPNIARVFDGGNTKSGLPYFVMEYVEGKEIDQYCDEQNLSITLRLDLFQQVCAAVSYAHRHSVIHRDIKPSNIFVTKDGVPKLLDFGIAKILQTEGEVEATATGVHMMTLEYASPEQAQGLSVTTLSDVYSLGVVLYELLTGYFPYELKSRTPLEIARAISSTQPQKPSTIIATVKNTDSPLRTPEMVSKSREGTPDRLRKRLSGDLDNIVLMALRKEPHRRYQSVEQFSEDIRRHLHGLPVAARKDTIGYRASKFVGRNKVASSAAIFAFLAILIAGVIQWRADQQAKFLQEFGQETAQIEGIMRFAHLRPLHDTSAERKIVLKRIQAINTRLQKLGKNAQGPGHYAIGKAWMALQQYGEARKSFELATRNYDYKTSDLYYAYGLTLAMIYQSELDFAARIAIKEEREVRINEIKKEFKKSALSYIQKGKQSVEYSEYAQAVVEFLDEDYEEAIERSQRAVNQVPWMYETKRLEAESNRQIGKRLLDQRIYSQALASYKKAEEAFKSSIQEGTSDPLGYIGLCSIQSDVLSLHAESGGKDEAVYLAGKEACLKALQAAPNSASAYLTMGTLNLEWARHLWGADTNAVTILEEAVQVVQHARDLQPEDPKTHKTLGQSYARLAGYHFYFVRKDPRKEVTLGDESFRKAIEINPNDADAYYLRAQMFETVSQYLIDSGENPQDALNKSRELIEKAISLNPKYFRFYLELGSILCVKAQYESEVGLDSSVSANSAIEAVRKALEKNPGHRPAFEYLAWANLVKAEYLATVGKNPIEALDQVEAATREAIRIHHKDAWSYRTLGQALLRKAEFSVNSQKDPKAFVNEAKEALRNGKEDDLVGWPVYTIGAELELVLGRWKMLNGESPESEFKRSEDLLMKAVELGPKPAFFEVWYSRARLFRWWAEWKIQSNRSAEKEIRFGLDAVSKALEMNPRSAEMIGTRGIFWLSQSSSIPIKSQRKELIEKASGCFEEAIQINSNVSYMFSPFLKKTNNNRSSH